MLNKNDVIALAEKYAELTDAVTDIIFEICKFNDTEYGVISEIEFDTVENGSVSYVSTTPSRCGCCGDERDYDSFPISYLWTEDWKTDLEARKVKRDLERKAEKERLEIARIAKQKADDLKKFDELKKKLGK